MNDLVHDRGAIVAVGDELVLGQTLDRNSRWLSARLADLGIRVVEHVTVADDTDRLASTLLRLSAGLPLVVVTGGLGPTKDDLTRSALARAMDTVLEEDEEALGWLEALARERGIELTDERRVQALRPRGARCLRNEVGTAPGIVGRIDSPVEILEMGDVEGRVMSRAVDSCDVVCLPGPPREMVPMFEGAVVGGGLVRGPSDRVVRTWIGRTFGLPEADVAARLGEMMDRRAGQRVHVGTTASGGVVSVRVRYEGPGAGAEAALEGVAGEVRARVGGFVFSEGASDEEARGLASVVVDALRERGERLVVVESCTGGMLGSMVTAVPGSSDVFEGGWITYSNAMKAAAVGVEAGLLDGEGAPGAVSREVALAMARGGLAAARAGGIEAGCAIAITGVAGPGHSERKAPGTVWVCVAMGEGVDARLFSIIGDRADVRERSAMLGLAMLRFGLVDGAGRAPRLIWETGSG